MNVFTNSPWTIESEMNRSRFEVCGIATCLAVAFTIRLLLILNRPHELTQDLDAYLGIATSVADGRGYSSPNSKTPTAFRPPLYPYVLATGMQVGTPALAVAGINLIAGLVTVWLTMLLGAMLQLGHWRFLAASLIAVDPLLVRYCCTPMTESLCAALVAFWLWAVLAAPQMAIKRHSSLASFLIGLAFGMLVLCRPAFWLIAFLYGLIWGISWLKSQTRGTDSMNSWDWRQVLISASGTALLVVPWAIRNGIVFGVPLLTTTHGGYTLFLGNNPTFFQEVVEQPWGAVWKADSLTRWQAGLEAQIQHDLGERATEIERDQWHSRQAWQFIASSPRACFRATLHRIRSLWKTMPQGESAEETSELTQKIVGWYYSLVLMLSVIGMVIVSGQSTRRDWRVLYVLIAAVQIVHLLYWTNTRMRAPLMPALVLFATATLARSWPSGSASRTLNRVPSLPRRIRDSLGF